MMYQVIRRLRRSLPKSLGCQRRVDCFAHAGNLFRIGRSKEREDSVCGEEQLKRQQLKGKEGIWGSLFAPCSVHTSLIPFSNLEPSRISGILLGRWRMAKKSSLGARASLGLFPTSFWSFKFSSRESAHSSRSRFFLNLVTSSSSSSYILLCCAPLYPYVLTNKVFVSDYLLGLDLNNKFGTLCDLF